MLRAVIDVGSNSIKLRIARVLRGDMQVVRDETVITRLAEGVSSTGLLTHEAMKASAAVITRMYNAAANMNIRPLVVATEALRTARNAHEFIALLPHGCEVITLSPELEAKYSWLGATYDLGLTASQTITVLDTGGGSSELTIGQNGTRYPEPQIIDTVSVPVGAVSLTERFFPRASQAGKPISLSRCEEAVEYVRGLFSGRDIITRFGHSGHEHTTLIATGGGVISCASTANASQSFSPTSLHHRSLSSRTVSKLIRTFASTTLEERSNTIGLPPGREDTITASACIIRAALDALGYRTCTVSINGLRHGLLLAYPATDELTARGKQALT